MHCTYYDGRGATNNRIFRITRRNIERTQTLKVARILTNAGDHRRGTGLLHLKKIRKKKEKIRKPTMPKH